MRVLSIALLLSYSVGGLGASLNEHWGRFQHFVREHEKVYETHDEFMNRWKIFADNSEAISAHTGSYSMEVNKFTDRYPSELTTSIERGFVYNTSAGIWKKPTASKCDTRNYSPSDTPLAMDWEEEGGVTEVKDQGQCGSCWSFSATGAMEGAWFVKTEELVSLSEQELLDCSKTYGNMGCNGGLMDGAFEFVMDNGLCAEDDVPYDAEVHRLGCEKADCTSIVQMSGCYDLFPSNEMLLLEAVAEQPVSVAIGADAVGFMSYSGGILTPDGCNTALDHGVLVVGYGEEDGEKYWRIKNSWGTDWGEDGYVRIARTESIDSDGTCGVAMQPSYPVAG
jgi:C1A family cysteine protease